MSVRTVTVRIEQEPQTAAPQEIFKTDDSAFGIWRDHENTADVVAYVRNLREPRYDRRGSRTKASEIRSGFPLLPSHSGEPTVTLQLVNQLRDDSI